MQIATVLEMPATAFPSDPAASVDTDGDGMPDDWNEGKTQADSYRIFWSWILMMMTMMGLLTLMTPFL